MSGRHRRGHQKYHVDIRHARVHPLGPGWDAGVMAVSKTHRVVDLQEPVVRPGGTEHSDKDTAPVVRMRKPPGCESFPAWGGPVLWFR